MRVCVNYELEFHFISLHWVGVRLERAPLLKGAREHNARLNWRWPSSRGRKLSSESPLAPRGLAGVLFELASEVANLGRRASMGVGFQRARRV